ncbi:2-succinyl-5-enolpyruvyl-6-hydroxy-3-cyclohexene-1-carboxylic-acid synthase [Rhodohalobacter sp. 8-1]|uniref:2-succinyl-5-enolpyruvyl-6-hydroxy-3- cyclohexene-1-carboxylic-acid synthase n=1 Tax=Rhodohalobacter sp. 8-1 TaxID=3131972 RepID=UPI0030EF9333
MNSEPRLLTPFSTASLLVRSFYNIGLRYVILSPGSRSTPLTMAFSYHSGFNKLVVLDERSAAFMALGIGKESGKPAILVCTSGTAAANYHPAIAEARQSGVPMIVCTADRPPSLRGVGSSQTLDQIKLYGDNAAWFHELGEPADTEHDCRRIEYAARQAMEEAIQSGGASHLNIPFRKPLEPSKEQITSEQKLFKEQLSETDPFSKNASVSEVSLSDEIIELINRSKRPLIIAGPADPFRQQHQSVLSISKQLKAPILAEPGSGIADQGSRIDRFEQILRLPDKADALEPDLILRFGDQPFTKSLLQSIHRWQNVPLIRFDARHSWQDHEMNTRHTISLASADRLNLNGIHQKDQPNYIDDWRIAEQQSQSELKKSLAAQKNLCDGHIFHHLSEHLPDTWNTVYSNSLPVRDAALFGYPSGQLFLNRGVAGIDGITSTAIGIARSSGSPTCCVIGDLAFLHDSNALLSLKNLSAPFLIVVINNNGGNIFRMLPIHDHKDVYTDYFETPQNANIQHLTLAHNLGYRRVETLDELRNLRFDDSATTEKPIVIECITNPDESMKLRRGLWGA